MASPLAEGDIVLCRFFNTPSGKFYGELFEATILRVVMEKGKKRFVVRQNNAPHLAAITPTLHRKEIKRRLR